MNQGRPEIFNTDQGAQFTSEAFTQMLQGQGAWMVRVGTWTTVCQEGMERRKRWKCHAAQEMREGPSEPGCRLRFQTT